MVRRERGCCSCVQEAIQAAPLGGWTMWLQVEVFCLRFEGSILQV